MLQKSVLEIDIFLCDSYLEVLLVNVRVMDCEASDFVFWKLEFSQDAAGERVGLGVGKLGRRNQNALACLQMVKL